MIKELLDPPYQDHWPDAFHILASYVDSLTVNWERMPGDDGFYVRRELDILYIRLTAEAHAYLLESGLYEDIEVYTAERYTNG